MILRAPSSVRCSTFNVQPRTKKRTSTLRDILVLKYRTEFGVVSSEYVRLYGKYDVRRYDIGVRVNTQSRRHAKFCGVHFLTFVIISNIRSNNKQQPSLTMNNMRNNIALLLLVCFVSTIFASIANDDPIRSIQKSGYVETSTPGRIVSLSRRSIAFYSEAPDQESFERGFLVGSAFVQKKKKTNHHVH